MKSIVSKHGVSPNNPGGSNLDMKTSSTEGREGIKTSTDGRNGGTYKQ